jgi:hypothetical protein
VAVPLCPSPGVELNLALSGGKPETSRPISGVALISYTKGVSCMSAGGEIGRHYKIAY